MGRLRLALLLAAPLALASCDRVAEADTGADADGTEAPAPPHEAPTLDALRAAHDFAAPGEGAACSDDRDCDSPLRCIDATCLFPPAMTGVLSDPMPYVEFEGTRRASTRYYLELASQPWETARGLMHRHSMVPDMGMLFVFERDAPRTFWMRETYIPLDMIFVTDAGVVDSFVENAAPQTDTTRASAGPARFVVELNAGEVSRMGLRAGTPVRFSELPEGLAPGGR